MSHRNLFTKVKTAKGRKLSSSQWLQRQLNDEYVLKAHKEGYRARSAYKLLEMDKKFGIFKKASVVVDLGSSPGSWSQIATQQKAAQVISVDLLEMSPLEGVSFIQGDFADEEVVKKIKELTNNKKVDILLSDIAPNTTGHRMTDHVRIMDLCNQVLDFGIENLSKNGSMVLKIFQGGEENDLTKRVKQYFSTVKYFKPESSRKKSPEIYIVAVGFSVD